MGRMEYGGVIGLNEEVWKLLQKGKWKMTVTKNKVLAWGG